MFSTYNDFMAPGIVSFGKTKEKKDDEMMIKK